MKNFPHKFKMRGRVKLYTDRQNEDWISVVSQNHTNERWISFSSDDQTLMYEKLMKYFDKRVEIGFQHSMLKPVFRMGVYDGKTRENVFTGAKKFRLLYINLTYDA